MSNSRWEVGGIGKPRGLNGDVRLHLNRPDPVYLIPGRCFLTIDDTTRELTFEVLDVSPKSCVIRLEGVSTREAAEAIRGAAISVDASWFVDMDERPPQLLLGASVVDAESNAPVGQVVDFYDNGAQLILGVEHDGRECLVPFVDAFVAEVSRDLPPVIRLHVIPGLLDDPEDAGA